VPFAQFLSNFNRKY